MYPTSRARTSNTIVGLRFFDAAASSSKGERRNIISEDLAATGFDEAFVGITAANGECLVASWLGPALRQNGGKVDDMRFLPLARPELGN